MWLARHDAEEHMKRILLFGLIALALALGIKFLITPPELVLYERPPDVAPEPIVLAAPPEGLHPLEEAVYRTQVSEELVRNIQPKLRELSSLFESGASSLPDSDLFTETIRYTGLKTEAAAEIADPQSLYKKRLWDESKAASDSQPSAIFASLLNECQLSKTKFGVLSGDLLEGDDQFEMMTSFEGQLHRTETGVAGFKSHQRIVWKKEADAWRISQWHQIDLKTVESAAPIFEEITASAIPDEAARAHVVRSAHMELMLKEAAGEELSQKSDPRFKFFNDWHSAAVFPSVSVVNFDGDEYEDLFLTGEWTSPVLMRNRGDGTFEDVTESAGLKMDEAHVNCAIFADFDNDGDSDVFLGRTTLPSLFFRNENGKFVPDEEVNTELAECSFVSSASAIDVNNDGLLDLYVSTYISYGSVDLNWIEHAIEREHQQKLVDKIYGRHGYVDRGGPPNRLFVNDGGTLRQTEINDTIGQWRNSFQPVWFDFDEDGDSDLYVCNDFSPDALLRNDSPRGSADVKFVDVTEEAFSDTCMAFGMGASVGDYDCDGQLDLYVSNMYSKAGNRVFKQLESTGVSPELKVAAAGNFLFRKKGAGFEQVAGLEKEDQQVSKVGWSFGGQFADFDNDGKQDLYVPSGLFTAPKEIERMDDL